ncbi:MAG: NFACT RNA binding domain-containing protein [Chloroflexota bacterium]|nr:NFACT RNA binding domain-containing protein [Chloroflexota bacterium]
MEQDLHGIHRYELTGGWIVLVGKSDRDNDHLSLDIAENNDWWFHVSGMPGSHVILKARYGESPDRNTLRRAAAIAAYHSKARYDGMTSVSYTQARYVTKPHRAKPGTVSIRRENILKVHPQLPPPPEHLTKD